MSANNNYVSEQIFASRVASHGRVTNLAEGFRLKDEQPFSLYIRPKTGVTTVTSVLVSVRLYKDEVCSPCPVGLGCWQEIMVCELDASNADLLNDYEIYWGAGSTGTPVTKQ